MIDCDEWIECWNCGGTGEGEHDCGEDSCCCLNPEQGECHICDGVGGWNGAVIEEEHEEEQREVRNAQ